MSDMETTIIPLDDAHDVLGTFRIGPSNRAYQRWKRDDGFRWVDLEDVLSESPLVLSVDWREWLQDAVDTIEAQLGSLGFPVDVELDDEGNRVHLEVEGTKAEIKYVPNDEDNFDDVIQSVNGLIKGKARYRKFRSCEGTDGWCYGLLANEDWETLELNAPNTTSMLFFSH